MSKEPSDSLLYFPKATLERLKLYQMILKDIQDKEYLSSDEMATLLSITPEQVRKDISFIRYSGKPKVGYHIASLLDELNHLFGTANSTKVVLVGVGLLGQALANYKGFEPYGMEIIALFDQDTEKIGKLMDELMVLPLKDMSRIVKRFKAEIGIICVPKESAQQVADKMIQAGIKAIWNFAPTVLKVPEEVIVADENMSISLLTLKHKLEQKRMG